MSKLSTKDVRHVAKLSNLKLSKKEIEKFREQLSEVVSYIEELNEVDTKDVEATSQTTGLINITRDDKIDNNRILSQKEAVSGSSDVHNGYFKVPMVLSERTER